MFKFIVRINFVLILAALLLVSCHKKEEPLVNEGRLEEVCRQMKEIQEGISEWYLESESPSDLLQHLDEIKSFEGVKDVYSDALNVYIDLDNQYIYLIFCDDKGKNLYFIKKKTSEKEKTPAITHGRQN